MREYHSEKRAVYLDEVLRLYYDEGYGARRIARILPVSTSTITNWIRTFAGNKPQRSYTMGKKKEESHGVVDQGQEETMEGLRKRIKSLETQLSKAETRADKAEIKAEAFKTLIEVAESKGMPVRKKSRRQAVIVLRAQDSLRYTVKYLCELFGVTKQAFYKRNDEGSHRRLAKEKMALEYIREIRTKDPGIGGRKLYYMYSDAFRDTHIGRDAFEALMAENGLKLRRKKRKPRTTDSRHGLPTYPDLTKHLLPSRSNELFVADITYISLWESTGLPKYCYLSLLMDAYTEEVKGWAVGATLETKYPLEALQMAMDNLDTQSGNLRLTHHSDRGVQYASNEYVEVLKNAGIAISMTETGNPKDNSLI